MSRKIISIVLALVSVLVLSVVMIISFRREEQPRPVIGILNYTKAAESSVSGFYEGMNALGYIDGENIEILYNGVIDNKALLKQEAETFISRPVDILVTMSTQATLIAIEAVEGTEIPIVFGPVSNPVENGIIADLRHEGEDITGIMFGQQEDKRLEMLKEINPDIKKVILPYNHEDLSPSKSVKKLETARIKLGLEFIHADVRSESELYSVLDNMPADVEAIFIPTDPVMAQISGQIAEYANSKGLISSAPHRDGVKSGALYSFSFDLIELGKDVARLTDQILRGTRAEDLPVESADFFLSINLTAAKQLDIEIPEHLMRMAVLYE